MQVRIRFIEDDMITPRKGQEEFVRDVDADEFLDLAEDIKEATRGTVFDNDPEIRLTDGAGQLLIKAISGQLYWSRPEDQNTQSIPTTADELSEMLFAETDEEAIEEVETPEEIVVVEDSGSDGKQKLMIGLLALVIVACIIFIALQVSVTEDPFLSTPASFSPVGTDAEGQIIWTDANGTYITNLEDGGYALVIAAPARTVRHYEITQLDDDDSLEIVLQEDLPGKAGTSNSYNAILGGDFALIEIQDDKHVLLFSETYERTDKPLKDMGDMVDPPPGE